MMNRRGRRQEGEEVGKKEEEGQTNWCKRWVIFNTSERLLCFSAADETAHSHALLL